MEPDCGCLVRGALRQLKMVSLIPQLGELHMGNPGLDEADHWRDDRRGYQRGSRRVRISLTLWIFIQRQTLVTMPTTGSGP